MTKCYLSYNNIISHLGFDTTAVFDQIKNGKSGIRLIEDPSRFYKPFYGNCIPSTILNAQFSILDQSKAYTRLEKMMLLTLSKTIAEAQINLDDKVGLIISTTKGNIDVLKNQNKFAQERAYLGHLGQLIANYFGFRNEPIIISNACVSGVLALGIAKRYVQEGIYDHVFIVAGDIISDFVLSGFNSFQALSDGPCKPYDVARNGINLGEVAASVLATSQPAALSTDAVEIIGEASRNDANHISGPSRTGEGLYRSVQAALKEAQINARAVDYISAHGTATLYNDEMEAVAFNRLNMTQTPLNSLKGFFGHTLGASGLLETIMGMQSLKNNLLIASKGFENLGVSLPLNIIESNKTQELSLFLKTASGFGGSNTAVVFKKAKTIK